MPSCEGIDLLKTLSTVEAKHGSTPDLQVRATPEKGTGSSQAIGLGAGLAAMA